MLLEVTSPEEKNLKEQIKKLKNELKCRTNQQEEIDDIKHKINEMFDFSLRKSRKFFTLIGV